MEKIRKLDELQLIKRGNVFKHGLFTLAGLILVNALLYSLGIEWAQGKWAELTIILFTVALCSIEFIYYDIYPFTEKRQKSAIHFLGLFGLAAMIFSIADIVSANSKIIVDGKLSSSALGVLYGLLFLAIWVAYILKKKYTAKHDSDD